MSNNSYEFNLYDNSCNSFANFMLFNKSKSKNKAIDLIQIKTNKTNKKDQSFNTIDLNPTFSEQFKSKSNSKEDKLLDHLHSSNFLKRKNTLLVNHLKNNQLFYFGMETLNQRTLTSVTEVSLYHNVGTKM